MSDVDRRAPHSAALTMLGNMLFNLRQPQQSCDRDEVVRCLAEVEEALRREVAALRAPAPVPGGGATKTRRRKPDGGARILAGLNDALAYAQGDDTRATLHTVTVHAGRIVAVEPPFDPPRPSDPAACEEVGS